MVRGAATRAVAAPSRSGTASRRRLQGSLKACQGRRVVMGPPFRHRSRDFILRQQSDVKRKAAPAMRTGAAYLQSLNDGRQVFVDGERVADVPAHPAFREAARSIARLYDVAADPANRELMTFTSPKTGAPVLRCFQIPRIHADLRARRL